MNTNITAITKHHLITLLTLRLKVNHTIIRFQVLEILFVLIPVGLMTTDMFFNMTNTTGAVSEVGTDYSFRASDFTTDF